MLELVLRKQQQKLVEWKESSYGESRNGMIMKGLNPSVKGRIPLRKESVILNIVDDVMSTQFNVHPNSVLFELLHSPGLVIKAKLFSNV